MAEARFCAGRDRFGALISALASNTHSNLLSTPSLLTLDNQEAYIIVGQNVPFKTGSYATNSNGADNPFTTVERKDVGISLKIKPTSTKVDAAAGGRAGSVGHRTLGIRHRLFGPDHQQACPQEHHPGRRWRNHRDWRVDPGQRRTQKSGVPLLRDIPYLGALFRWSRDTQSKSNLMVFLRPTIVRSKEDLINISQQRYNALRDLSQPGAVDNNSLLLPAESRQLFEPVTDAPVIDLRKPAPNAP